MLQGCLRPPMTPAAATPREQARAAWGQAIGAHQEAVIGLANEFATMMGEGLLLLDRDYLGRKWREYLRERGHGTAEEDAEAVADFQRAMELLRGPETA